MKDFLSTLIAKHSSLLNSAGFVLWTISLIAAFGYILRDNFQIGCILVGIFTAGIYLILMARGRKEALLKITAYSVVLLVLNLIYNIMMAWQ